MIHQTGLNLKSFGVFTDAIYIPSTSTLIIVCCPMKQHNSTKGECVLLSIFLWQFSVLSTHIYCLFYIFRLTATSWNLAQNKSNSIVGFSGTNDNHRILPLQVRQYFASKEEHTDPILNNLEGTNGRMLQDTFLIEEVCNYISMLDFTATSICF